jgi:hypothetical protein
MKRKRLVNALSRSLGLLTLAILFIVAPPMANAQRSNPTTAADAPVRTSNGRSPLAITAAATSESWRLGVTSEGAAAYNAIIGRAVGDVAAFRSNRGTTDVYHIFPAPGTRRTVQAARFYILTRTGTYADAATLTLEILDYGGTVQHTVSAAGIDVTAAPTSTWTAITLSGTPADLEIAPGEFLAFHFSLSGAPAGDLDVRPIFEVEVE